MSQCMERNISFYTCAEATITSVFAERPNTILPVSRSSIRTVTSPKASIPAVTEETVY